MITYQRITIVKQRAPKHDVNEELQWLGSSFGLFGLRDKDKSCFRIFIELIKAARQDAALSSDELAFRTGLSRGTVLHHLNKLQESGMVREQKSRYLLRVHRLSEMVRELREDMERTMEELEHVAQDIDRRLE